jgi:hypothetical protein
MSSRVWPPEATRLTNGGFSVTGQVVDHHEGFAGGVGQGLCRRHAHEQRADQAGTLRDGDDRDVREGATGLPEGIVDDRVDGTQMVAGGDLRHDAPVRGVQRGLGGDDRRPHMAALDDRRGGLIARGFDGEDGPVDHPVAAASRGS